MSDREYLKIRRTAFEMRERIAWVPYVVFLFILAQFSKYASNIRELCLIGAVALTIYFVVNVVRIRRLNELGDKEERRLQELGRKAMLDLAIAKYFTIASKSKSRASKSKSRVDSESILKEVEGQFRIDLFQLKVRLDEIYEDFSKSGKLSFAPDLDIEDEDLENYAQ